MEKETLQMLKVADIVSHPKNPRKDLGDLTELTESIRKNGVMQNLTVISNGNGTYTALIGHRRLAAAAAAGLKEIPAKVIEGLPEREQVSIMLEENMQRNDLTVVEQAQGFQMMLDLGESEETIAEKTGFSRKTVKSRLEIAKLDPDLVTRAVDSYQITLADLSELQKVTDPEKRNKILGGCTSKWQIINEVGRTVEKEKEAEALKRLRPIFKEKGIEKGKGDNVYNSWSSGFVKVAEFDTLKMPEEIEIKEIKKKKLFWTKPAYDRMVYVYYSNNRNVQKEDPKQQQEEERREQLRTLAEGLRDKEKKFILRMVDGTYTIKKTEELETWRKLWPFIEESLSSYGYGHDYEGFFKGTDYEEDPPSVAEIYRAIISVYLNIETKPFNYFGEYSKEDAQEIQEFINMLAGWGFEIDPDEVALLAGTHKLYKGEK